AVAIVEAARERGVALAEPRDFRSHAGMGVTGIVEAHQVVLGGREFLAEHGAATAPLDPEAARRQAEGATAIFAAIDGQCAGLLALADPLKPTARAALDRLRA